MIERLLHLSRANRLRPSALPLCFDFSHNIRNESKSNPSEMTRDGWKRTEEASSGPTWLDLLTEYKFN